jgi:hypothetical protein
MIWTMLAIAALASLAFVLTIQQQNAAALYIYNTQSHTQIGGQGASTDIRVTNTDDQHINENFNSQREDTYKVNTIDKP